MEEEPDLYRPAPTDVIDPTDACEYNDDPGGPEAVQTPEYLIWQARLISKEDLGMSMMAGLLAWAERVFERTG
jgi:hypothetical protein